LEACYASCWDTQQDPVRYRQLVDHAEERLRDRNSSAAAIKSLLAKFRHLADDHVFWTHRTDGLAVLGSPSTFDVFDLPRTVPELVAVSDSFSVQPLLRFVQSADRFHVLCLQRDAIHLFEGNRDGLERMEPAGVPLTAKAALEQAVTTQRPQARGAEEMPSYQNAPHGVAAKHNDAQLEQDRFFRIIDQAVEEHVSRPSQCPLVLAGVAEHQAQFRRLSRNPQLVDAGIEHGPPFQPDKAFLAAAWKCLGPKYRARLDKIANDFQIARSRQMASDDIDEVSTAVARDRVGILLVEANRTIPGHFDPVSRRATRGLTSDAGDLLDDLAEQVMRADGTVVVVPRERMPVASGVAAIYRF
jgi:hypothetical protein